MGTNISRKGHTDTKKIPKMNCALQLHTHNVPADDMEKTYGKY